MLIASCPLTFPSAGEPVRSRARYRWAVVSGQLRRGIGSYLVRLKHGLPNRVQRPRGHQLP